MNAAAPAGEITSGAVNIYRTQVLARGPRFQFSSSGLRPHFRIVRAVNQVESRSLCVNRGRKSHLMGSIGRNLWWPVGR